MFLAMRGTFLVQCLVLGQASGRRDKNKWMIIETEGNTEMTPAKKSGSRGTGQDFSLVPGVQDLGTAVLRCDSEIPFDKCQFRSPTGEVTVLGTRCQGATYGTRRGED
eukprot:TRINITY_DN13072_c0_g1_i4.p1 TRINITY_DN13072_c0_g1~~TRINITY_DN13072_c0_g1_i4.p1  ORF type:complete len:108 (-),score=19.63 TRINITY_DN13072_c0_g1_i4:117-440(-)